MKPIYFDLGILPVGKYCDLMCKGCFQRVKIWKDFLDVDSSVISHLEKLGFSQCFIGGGEPLLHDNLREILERLSKTFFIRYLLTHGYNLSDYSYLSEYAETIVVSVDPMHKRAMEKKYRTVLYPNDIFSSVGNGAFHRSVRINSVISCSSEMPFFYKLAQYISRSKNVKGWNIYRNTSSGISDSEYLRIVDALNNSSALSFQVEPKIPSELFIQILVFPDLSAESYSFNSNGALMKKHCKDVTIFMSQEEFLAEIGRIHGKNGSFSQIYRSNEK